MSSNLASSSSDVSSVELVKFVSDFWDHYQNSGIEVAAKFFKDEVNGNLAITQLLVPHLIEGGYARNIDMTEAVKDFQSIAIEEANDASGTTDDGGEFHTDGSPETVADEDEAQPAESGSVASETESN